MSVMWGGTPARRISPARHDRFVKLPVRHPGVIATASAGAIVSAPSLPEGEPSPEPTIQELKARIHELETQLVNSELADPRNRIFCRDIIAAVCYQFEITKTILLSRRRDAGVVLPRQVCMYLMKILTVHSLPEIGRRTGGYDHTTVLHACRKITEHLTKDERLAADIEAIKKSLQPA